METEYKDVAKTQTYWNGESFEVECPFCFGRCYCFSDDDVVCEENPEHRFSLA